MPKKILALVSEPVSGEALGNAVGRERAEAAEVLVVEEAQERFGRPVEHLVVEAG